MLRISRLCGAVVMASALGTANGVAQSPPREVPHKPAEEVRTVVIEEAQAREWELLVELDLMADAVTFPHALRCKVGSAGLEVRGYVPSALVRDRALASARKKCPVDVVNAMVIQPNILYNAPGQISLQDVQSRLSKAATKQGNTLRVQLGSTGQVVLHGQATSLEEKVRFSRALRGLPGCTAVKNELATPAGSVSLPVMTASVPPRTDQAEESRPTKTVTWKQGPPLPSTDNPLMPPPGRPTLFQRGPRSSGVAQMPPAPVPPNRQADYRPSAEESVVQISKQERSSKPDAKPTAPAGPPAQSAAAPPASPPLPPRAQQAFKQRLRGALGPAVREVELKGEGKRGVKVIVHVIDKNYDLERIAKAIVSAPELKDVDVSIEFRVD